jgi:hypothetical protein
MHSFVKTRTASSAGTPEFEWRSLDQWLKESQVTVDLVWFGGPDSTQA